MGRLTVGQKAQRLLKFMMGLGNPANMHALQRYGFDQAALDEGWTLLRQIANNRLAMQRILPARGDQLTRLDAWENHWFPIVWAVLQRQHPEVHATVFLNLAQTEGRQVVLSVSTLVERLDALGADSPAMVTLRKHGLTEAVLEEARGLLRELMSPALEEAPPAEPQVFDQAAEDAMWSYYLQWSAIARRAIKDRRLLRQLGFLRSSQGSAGEDEALDGDAPDGDAPDTPAQ